MPKGHSSARIVLSNSGALLVIQIANQLFPLLLIPYLTRVLGVSIYGVVAFGFAIVQIACVITDYGFNLSITPKISQYRENVKYVNRLIGAVFLCKVLLLAIAIAGLVAFAFLTDRYSAHLIFFLLLIISLVGQTFQPIWFFQGIEKMAYITLFTLIARIVYLILIFAFISSADEYEWIVIANGISQVLAAVLAIIFMLKQGYRPAWPGLKYAKEIIRHSTEFFWSRAAVSSYMAGGTLFLGLIASPLQLGYYVVADQMYKGAQALLAPLAQALYPNMVRSHDFSLLFRSIKWAMLLCLIGLIFGAISGPWLIPLIFGANYTPSYIVLLVLLTVLLVNTPSVLLGYPLLGAIGYSRLVNRSTFIGGAFQLILFGICFLLNWDLAFHVALTVLAVETLVLILRTHWSVHHYKIWHKTIRHN